MRSKKETNGTGDCVSFIHIHKIEFKDGIQEFLFTFSMTLYIQRGFFLFYFISELI